jgi:hypothetical protein
MCNVTDPPGWGVWAKVCAGCVARMAQGPRLSELTYLVVVLRGDVCDFLPAGLQTLYALRCYYTAATPSNCTIRPAWPRESVAAFLCQVSVASAAALWAYLEGRWHEGPRLRLLGQWIADSRLLICLR